jgi:peptide methionine sulfoxide reductase MsrB
VTGRACEALRVPVAEAVCGKPTGLRYCINGVALAFEPAQTSEERPA